MTTTDHDTFIFVTILHAYRSNMNSPDDCTKRSIDVAIPFIVTYSTTEHMSFRATSLDSSIVFTPRLILLVFAIQLYLPFIKSAIPTCLSTVPEK